MSRSTVEAGVATQARRRIVIAVSSLATSIASLCLAQTTTTTRDLPQGAATRPAPGGGGRPMPGRPGGGQPGQGARPPRPGAGADRPGGGNRPPSGGQRPPAPVRPRPPIGGGGRPPGAGHRPNNSFYYFGRYRPRVHGGFYRYPPGFAYRRWSIGQVLPLLFLTPTYVFGDYSTLGLDPPPFGYQWVRYGPDLLLVDQRTGRIADAVYGAVY